MHILAHLGATDNEYILAVKGFRPGGCPSCHEERVHQHDVYWRYGSSRTEKVPIRRFRCARPRCRKVFSVLPSYLVAGQSYPAAIEEVAVATYSAGAAPLASVAAALGVGTTTVFRWVDRVCMAIAAWLVLLQQVLMLLQPSADITVVLREGLRTIWRARRIRRPGKVGQLLLLDQWPPWVQRLRRLVSGWAADSVAWLGSLAYWRGSLEVLSQFVSSTTGGGKARVLPGW